MTNKEYLGDGVYVDLVPNYVVLTTENGFEATNSIYLEEPVLDKFNKWLERHFK